MLDSEKISDFLTKNITDTTNLSVLYTYKEIFSWWESVRLDPAKLVIISLPNSALLLYVYFTVLLNKQIPLLVPPNLPRERLLKLVNTLGASALVRHGLTAETSSYRYNLHYYRGLKLELFVQPAKAVCFRAGEVALSTSGTSGFGSACVFDFASLYKNAVKHAESIALSTQDRILVNLPLYFSYALVAQTLSAFACNATLILSGPPFHRNTYNEMIEKYQISCSSLTPLLLKQLLSDCSLVPTTLKKLTVGGSKAEIEDIKNMLNLMQNTEIYLTYGLTEAGPRISTLRAHCEPEQRLGSVGKVLPNTKLKIVEDAGMGELFIQSDTLMKRRVGIIDNAHRKDFDNEGYLATGDVFQQDSDGYLYFVKRLDKVVIINGEKICFPSIKRLLLEIPLINGMRFDPLPEENSQYKGYELYVNTHRPLQIVEQNILMKEIKKLLRVSERPKNIIFEFGMGDGGRHK